MMVNQYLCNDTWYIDGGAWVQQLPASPPAVRCCEGLAFDTLHNQLVMFGGGGVGRASLDETDIWDGTNWCVKGSTC
jgi:hypothetical protein